MSLVCTRMWFLSTYVICMSLVCGFTMNQIKYRLTRKCFSLASLNLIHVKSSRRKECFNISEVQPAIKCLVYRIILYRKRVFKNCTVTIRQKQLLRDVVQKIAILEKICSAVQLFLICCKKHCDQVSHRYGSVVFLVKA